MRVGSLWIDTTADKTWICVDASAGAAVWQDLSASLGGGDADTVDGSDAADLVNRANHTGTQTAATISDFATAVTATGAIQDSDITAGEGLLRKTGAGTYVAIKTNLLATVAPAVGDDGTAGYADKAWVCVDASSSGTVTIDGNGTTIDGAATISMSSQYQYRKVYFDGSAWFVLGSDPAYAP